MPYQVYFEYKGGSSSHYLKTNCRTAIEEHLGIMLRDREVCTMADKITVKYGNRYILNVNAALPRRTVMQKIQWPKGGAPKKVPNAVTATFYIPEAVRDWLTAKGNGKMNEGLRQMMMESGIKELENAYNILK